MTQIKRPGRTEWEDGTALDIVPMEDVVGSLIRYDSGITLRVNGLSDADGSGVRYLNFEVYDPTQGE